MVSQNFEIPSHNLFFFFLLNQNNDIDQDKILILSLTFENAF